MAALPDVKGLLNVKYKSQQENSSNYQVKKRYGHLHC